MAQFGDDCYFYYYSSCSKGDNCPYRHCPEALGNEVICTNWRKGKCYRNDCMFRHMDIKIDRSCIPCYWESQPSGCTKQHCVFKHYLEKDEFGTAIPIRAPSDKKDTVKNTVKTNSPEPAEIIVPQKVEPVVVNPLEESDQESTCSPLIKKVSPEEKPLEEKRRINALKRLGPKLEELKNPKTPSIDPKLIDQPKKEKNVNNTPLNTKEEKPVRRVVQSVKTADIPIGVNQNTKLIQNKSSTDSLNDAGENSDNESTGSEDSELNFKVKTLAEIRAAKSHGKIIKNKAAVCSSRESKTGQPEKQKVKQARQIYVPPAVRQQSEFKDSWNGTDYKKEPLEKLKLLKTAAPKNVKVEVPVLLNLVKQESDFTGQIRVKTFAEIMEEKRLRAKRNEDTGKTENFKSHLSDFKPTNAAPKVPSLALWTRKRSSLAAKPSLESEKSNEPSSKKKSNISSDSPLTCTSDARLKNTTPVPQDAGLKNTTLVPQDARLKNTTPVPQDARLKNTTPVPQDILNQTVTDISTDRLPSDETTTDNSSNIPSIDSLENLPKAGNAVKSENSSHLETEELKCHTGTSNSSELNSQTHLNDESILKDEDLVNDVPEANCIEDDDDVLRQLEEMLACQ